MGVIFGVRGRRPGTPPPFSTRIREAKKPDGTPAYSIRTAMALLAFFLLACQCMSTLSGRAARDEELPLASRARRHTRTARSYVAAFAVYQIGGAARSELECDPACAHHRRSRSSRRAVVTQRARRQPPWTCPPRSSSTSPRSTRPSAATVTCASSRARARGTSSKAAFPKPPDARVHLTDDEWTQMIEYPSRDPRDDPRSIRRASRGGSSGSRCPPTRRQSGVAWPCRGRVVGAPGLRTCRSSSALRGAHGARVPAALLRGREPHARDSCVRTRSEIRLRRALRSQGGSIAGAGR